MTQNTIQLPKELAQVVDARSSVWEDYDMTQRKIIELNKLSRQVNDSVPPEVVNTLTPQNTPQSELTKAIEEINVGLQAIASFQGQIESKSAEIRQIKQRVMITYIVIGVAVILLTLILVNALAQ